MARGFRIHSGAVFNPFTLKELREPIQEYNQAYSQMQDYMLTAGEEANQYRQLVDTDEWARGVLKGYNDTLSNVSTQLAREGLKSINKSTILGLRREYNDKVKPVNDAAKTLAGLQEMYRQAYAKDQTMMRGAMPSIKDLVENPSAMPQMVSGVQLYNQGNAASKSASLRNFSETEFGKRIIRGYIEKAEEIGYSPELVRQFMQDASAIPELAAEIVNIQQMYNTMGLQNPEQANRFIMQGILDGIQYQRKTDYKYDQLGAEYRAAARKKAEDDALSGLQAYLKPFNMYSQNEATQAAKDIDDYMKYFDRTTSGWTLNKKGEKELERLKRNKEFQKDNDYAYSGESGVKQKNLLTFIEDNLREGETPGQAYERYYNSHRYETYDTHQDTGYRYIPQSDDLAVLEREMQALGVRDKHDNYITYDYDRKTRSYIESGKVKPSDIKNFSDIEISDSGIVVNAVKKDGSIVKLKMPGAMSSYDWADARANMHSLKEREAQFENYRDSALRDAEAAGYILQGTIDPMDSRTMLGLYGALYGQQGQAALGNAYLNYQATQKAIYDSVANMLRTIDSSAAKL